SIEMARVISQFADEIESTLILMTVTGEDQGLFGSTAYADWAFENNLRIDGMITNDVVGNITGCVDPACTNNNFITDSTSVRHFSGGPSTSSSRQLTRFMKLKAEQYITEVPWTVTLIPSIDRPGRGGDHQPFFDNGYTAARFTEPHEFGDGSGNNGRQHNEFDLVEFVNIPYVARIVKNNIAGLATLAMAPETPSDTIEIQNVGNGTDLLLSWTATNSEPDFEGYRVAVRHSDSLFYEQIVPVGNVTEYLLTGLTPDQPVYICYSAIDTSGNESIFSSELLVTPSDIPAIPQGVDITSMSSEIHLSWLPNAELDLNGYKITRVNPDQSIMEFDIDSSNTTFVDNSAIPHILYLYSIQARDTDNNLSTPSESKRGQLATHDLGIMILDASRDGPGIQPLLPSDEQVDDYYENLLDNFNVSVEWDIADSLEQNLSITDADMGIYSVIVLHSEVRNQTHSIAEDTVALRKYLQNGGHLLMSGWQLIESASDKLLSVNVFSSGDFVHDVMQIDTSENAITNDFRGADALVSDYVSITVDSVKIPNFGGDLITMEVLRSLTGGIDTEVLHIYRSSSQPPSEFHGLPVSLRHITNDLGIVIFDFPLYYMMETEARQNITQGLMDLGEVTGIEDEGENTTVGQLDFKLIQNYPNPFNPNTIIEFQIPAKSNVHLSLYNTIGEQILVLVDEEKDAGTYEIELSGVDLPSGVYFYQLRAGDRIETKKMILLK
ncbi:MAG: T9SS type A sorting domain-containing protein, partial [Ignavibacteria bacterium]|nr:T9SS type A sorting domain-containing protein [Ignavibacteria bacterium]